MADNASLFLVADYRMLMGAFGERKKELGLTNLDLDERGGFAGGYTGKLFCGSKRLGLETLGRMLDALDCQLLVVPKGTELSLPKLTKQARPIKDLSREVKDFLADCGRRGGRKRHHLLSRRRRRAIACMAGRASGEARRLRKAGKEYKPKPADPLIMRKLDRPDKR